jgi:hypothetical protein
MAQTTVALAAVASTNEFIETALGTGSALAGQVVKSGAGTTYVIEVDNSANAAITYLKCYHSNGAITVGTTAPDEIHLIPGLAKVDIIPVGGKAFAAGLQVAAVTAGGTAGTTAPTSSTIVRIVYA